MSSRVLLFASVALTFQVRTGHGLQLAGGDGPSGILLDDQSPIISRRDDGKLDRILLDADEVHDRGSYCLDGSQPAIYYEPADTKQDPTAATKWLLTFPGGGWCKNEDECAKRYHFPMASRENIDNSFAIFGNSNVKGQKKKSNFAAYHHVVLWYCDGGIFGGDRDDTVSWPDPRDTTKNVTMYFRGRRVLKHMIETLLKPRFGLSSATEVLLSGGSTGGFATYMHADFVADLLPKSVTKFRAAPAAGWFAYVPAWMKHGTAQYLEEMSSTYKLHGLAGSGPSACYEALPEEDHMRCIFADYSYAYSRTPMFVLQAMDSFLAIQNESSVELSQRNFDCVGYKITGERCSDSDASRLNGLLDGMVENLQATTKFNGPSEGGFLSSCPEHSFYENAGFYKFTDAKGVTISEAIEGWWASDNSASADWHLPCKLNSKPPYQCAACEL